MLKVVVCSEPPGETEGEAGKDGKDEATWDVGCGGISKDVTEREGGEKESAY